MGRAARVLARLAAVVPAIGLGAPDAADAQIGVMAGYNRDLVEDFDPQAGFDLTDRTDGFHIGIFFNINLGPLGIRPALVYHRVPELVAASPDAETAFDLELVEIPLDLRLRIPIPVARPYLLAGPVLTFPSTADLAVNDLLADRPIRIEAGAGLELDLGFRLWPEIRYGRGVEPLLRPDIPIGDGVLMGTGSPRLDTVTFRLGISF